MTSRSSSGYSTPGRTRAVPRRSDARGGKSFITVAMGGIAVFWIAVVFYFVWRLYRRFRRRNQPRRREQDRDDPPITEARAMAEKLSTMTTKAKLAYYDELFEKHGNQTKLRNDQIIVQAIPTNATAGDAEDKEEDDIEAGKSGPSTSIPEHPCGHPGAVEEVEGDLEDQLPVVYLSKDIIRHPCGESENSDQRNGDIPIGLDKATDHHPIHGQCVICLENFKAGDMVVYNIHAGGSRFVNNEDPKEPPIKPAATIGCSHVFHKSCMVEYLAHRKISNRGIQNGEADAPSCPTCRVPYCQHLASVLCNHCEVSNKPKEAPEDTGSTTSVDMDDSRSFEGDTGSVPSEREATEIDPEVPTSVRG